MKDSLRMLATSPWALAREFLPAVADVLEFRLSGVPLTAEEVAARVGVRSDGSLPTGNGAVAVIPIRGIISPDAEDFFFGGGVAPESIAARLNAAMQNDDVSAIVLAIDSPGGSVYGVPELADRIAAASKEKKIVAVANGMMASAAYYIGSAASEVVTTPSGQVGSIGVISLHADLSRMLQNDGIDVTIIKAGKYKGEGNPFGPLSDEDKAAMTARVEDYYDQFVNAVARHRGVTSAAVRTGFGQGRIENARAALRSGMVDRVATLDSVLTELVGGKRKSNGVRATADPPPDPQDQNLTTLPIAASAQGGDLVSGLLDGPSTVTAGSGGPPAVRLVSPSAPAPKAKENTVPALDTAAQNGADPNAAATFDDLMALAETHGKPVATVRQWMKNGKSVADVQAELLTEYRQGARPLRDDPPTNGETRITGMRDREAEQPFASLGEQLQAIANAFRS